MTETAKSSELEAGFSGGATGWAGDLDDDCSLVRYGMHAHVECMDKGVWWFAISPWPWQPGHDDLYNTANNETAVRLTTGKMARAAAECCLEVLHATRPNAEVERRRVAPSDSNA